MGLYWSGCGLCSRRKRARGTQRLQSCSAVVQTQQQRAAVRPLPACLHCLSDWEPGSATDLVLVYARRFYRRQRKIQGCFFQHLRLTRRQAGRGASETDSVELLAAEEGEQAGCLACRRSREGQVEMPQATASGAVGAVFAVVAHVCLIDVPAPLTCCAVDPVVMRKRSSLGAASSRASINQATEGGPVPEIAAHSQVGRHWDGNALRCTHPFPSRCSLPLPTPTLRPSSCDASSSVNGPGSTAGRWKARRQSS